MRLSNFTCRGGLFPLCLAISAASCGAPTQEMETAHSLEEIAPGVYCASSQGTGEMLLMSNAMVIVNDDDVIVVDSHITAESGRSLIEAVRTVTDLPIRYLVNTHFHFDHAHGNQAFAEHDHLDIVGHEYTREKMTGDALAESSYLTLGAPEAMEARLEVLESSLENAADDELNALTAQAAMMRRHIVALAEVEPTPPSLTINERMSIFRGEREIRLVHLGRGHTGGDVVVHLPSERLVFTGDLFFTGAPFLGDGFADEYPETLERLKDLDVDMFVPGHGPIVTDKDQIQVTQNYLADYWTQVSEAHLAGLTVDEAVAEVDLSSWSTSAGFSIRPPAVMALEVAQMYRRIEAR